MPSGASEKKKSSKMYAHVSLLNNWLALFGIAWHCCAQLVLSVNYHLPYCFGMTNVGPDIESYWSLYMVRARAKRARKIIAWYWRLANQRWKMVTFFTRLVPYPSLIIISNCLSIFRIFSTFYFLPWLFELYARAYRRTPAYAPEYRVKMENTWCF